MPKVITNEIYTINNLSNDGQINSVDLKNNDGTTTHVAPGTSQWDAYQAWLDAGNKPNPPRTAKLCSAFTSSEGVVLSNEFGLEPGDDFAQDEATLSIFENHGVLLSDSTGSSFKLDQSETALAAKRLTDSDASHTIGYELYSRTESGDVIQRVFSADGQQQLQATLNTAQISLAEVETGIDLDNNNVIGGTVTGELYSNDASDNNISSNFTIYNTSAGLVSAIGNYSINIGAELSSVAWQNTTSASSTMAEGIRMLSANGEPFQLANDQSIITGKRSTQTGTNEYGNGSSQSIELFVSSTNGEISQYVFNTSGELSSQKVLSDGEIRDQEIRINTDLDGDGIVGITLGEQLLDRKGDPNITYNALLTMETKALTRTMLMAPAPTSRNQLTELQ